MSQYNEIADVQTPEEQSDFDAGFDAAENTPEQENGIREDDGTHQDGDTAAVQPEEKILSEPADETLPAAEPEPAVQTVVTAPVKNIEVPEELADELDALKQLNPQAAELALEDSPDGESIRRRLTDLGALAAQDRAEHILEKRERATREQRAEVERNRQAIEAHNRRFMAVLQRDHPEYTALLMDPARKVDAGKAMQDIYDWISAKPYAEAAPLMEIAKHGRDPDQVSALITRYKQEGKTPRKARPEGAFAVPARGATSAPSGDEENADDFDAGFNLE